MQTAQGKRPSPILNHAIRTATDDPAVPVYDDRHPDVIKASEFGRLHPAVKHEMGVWIGVPLDGLKRVQINTDGTLLCHFLQRDRDGNEVTIKNKSTGAIEAVCVGRIVHPDPRFDTPPWYGTRAYRRKTVGHREGVAQIIVGPEPDPEHQAWQAKQIDEHPTADPQEDRHG